MKVFGKYALSITSQDGHILIQTDINMTCVEKVPDTTCLGGFTQSSTPKRTTLNPKTDVYEGKIILRYLLLCFCFPFLLLLELYFLPVANSTLLLQR